jgi:hypothetical protein
MNINEYKAFVYFHKSFKKNSFNILKILKILKILEYIDYLSLRNKIEIIMCEFF